MGSDCPSSRHASEMRKGMTLTAITKRCQSPAKLNTGTAGLVKERKRSKHGRGGIIPRMEGLEHHDHRADRHNEPDNDIKWGKTGPKCSRGKQHHNRDQLE